MSPSPFQPEHFQRADDSDDSAFYVEPRLVAHIDDAARAALAAFYRETLRPDSDVLDLMSSYHSHLPEDVTYKSVTGLGMNPVELTENRQLSSHLIHDLNKTPELPFPDASFDACLLAVSAQYLVRPIEVFASIRRVLRPNGCLIVSYSNRLFPTKAVELWQRVGMEDRGRLVSIYCWEAAGFRDVEARDISPAPGVSDPLWVVTARRAET
ncbi:MAG: methyltransferase domain-containing protein [Alphaproteobacteria bacterium]|nr:methyltransferase domain-containing protein [Alphaproteobacteria bacterium]